MKHLKKMNESILPLSEKPKDFMMMDLSGKYRIKLSGSDGNAIALIGYATIFSIKKGYDYDQLKEVLSDMTTGTYEELLQIFDEHFGEFVNIYR